MTWLWLVVLVLGVDVVLLQRRLRALEKWVRAAVADADSNFANCVTHDELRETCFAEGDTRTMQERLDDSTAEALAAADARRAAEQARKPGH